MRRAARRLGLGLGLLAAAGAGLAGCAKDQAQSLRALRDEACACKTKECAAGVGRRLAKRAVEGELDETTARLAMEASGCLATFGE